MKLLSEAQNIDPLPYISTGHELSLINEPLQQIPFPRNTNTADLSLTGTISPPNANLQDQLTYTYAITNNGPDPVSGVTFTDELPLSTTNTLVTTSQGQATTDANATVVATLGNLAPGESATVVIQRNAAVANILTNNASVEGIQTDPNPANNTLQQQVPVSAVSPTPADLELSFDVPGGSSGGNGAYPIVLTITNKGLGIATDIQIQTTLPEEVTILGNSAEQGTFDPITGTWDVGNIRDNLSRDLVLNIAVDSDDRVDVIAEVSSVFESDPDSTPGNDNPDEDDRAVAQVDRDGGIGSTTDPDRLRFLQLYGLA